jgi:hypothetical protein
VSYTPTTWPFTGAELPGGKEFVGDATVGTDGVPSPPESGVSPAEWNETMEKIAQAGEALTAGDYHGLRDMDGGMPDTAPTGGARIACRNGRLEISENGKSWRRLTGEDGYYDIRDYGAVPGSAGKVATTAAFQAIFEELSYSYFPTVNGERNAIIFVPFTRDTGWYVDELTGYIGSPGARINIFGEVGAGRAGTEGSVLVYDGAAGGTLLDLQAPNASEIRNITFNGGRKAKYLLHARQYWNEANSSQVGSSGLIVRDCFFVEPQNEYDSVMVAAGQDDDPPNTLQSSEYRFYDCSFQGLYLGAGLTRQGWGFKALNAGNTKNFVFENCTFSYCHRGIECSSGYLIVKECNAANLGYDRADSAMIYGTGNSWVILGGGLENVSLGFAARFLVAGQGTTVFMSGVYVTGATPGDDYMISLNGPAKLIACDIGNNSRSSALTLAWTALEAVLVGQERKNGGKLYKCITAGTTAGAGGPSGTGSDITDGTAHWQWVTSDLTGNVCKILGASLESVGWGGVSVEHCTFAYNTTVPTGVPIYDGSNNPIWGSNASDNTDYPKTTSHKVSAKGCSTGLWGSNINVQLPDFSCSDQIVTRDQLWTNNNAAGLTVVRNANGVYIVTVPAAAVAAAVGGLLQLCCLPAKFKLLDCIMDVTTLFSGPGVSGITAQVGIEGVALDALLTSQALNATGQHGVDPADYGASLTTGRYVTWTTSPYLRLKVAASGGSIANINAGSLTIYLHHKRLGA